MKALNHAFGHRPAHGLGGRGFTLIEVLITLSVAAVLLAVVAPAFNNFILVQRLKSINAQLVTDIQMTRAEAVSRNTLSRVFFKSNTDMTCYSIYVLKPNSDSGIRCDCTRAPGSACQNTNAIEIRTVQVPVGQGVRISTAVTDGAMAFDPTTGGLVAIPEDDFPAPLESFVVYAAIDSARQFTTTVGRSGRPSVCSSAAQLGAPSC